jgi:hypothetical protein
VRSVPEENPLTLSLSRQGRGKGSRAGGAFTGCGEPWFMTTPWCNGKVWDKKEVVSPGQSRAAASGAELQGFAGTQRGGKGLTNPGDRGYCGRTVLDQAWRH